jgi:hypothetical protein
MDFQGLVEKEKEKVSIVLGSVWPETAHNRRNAPTRAPALKTLRKDP